MARNEQRGRRGRVRRQRDTAAPAGPKDPEEHTPSADDLRRLQPPAEFVEDNEDEE